MPTGTPLMIRSTNVFHFAGLTPPGPDPLWLDQSCDHCATRLRVPISTLRAIARIHDSAYDLVCAPCHQAHHCGHPSSQPSQKEDQS